MRKPSEYNKSKHTETKKLLDNREELMALAEADYSIRELATKYNVTSTRIYNFLKIIGFDRSRIKTKVPSIELTEKIMIFGYNRQQAIDIIHFQRTKPYGNLLTIVPCLCDGQKVCYPHYLQSLRDRL